MKSLEQDIETTGRIVAYLERKGKMSGRDICADLKVTELDVETAWLAASIIRVRPEPGGTGSWFASLHHPDNFIEKREWLNP